MFSLPSNHVLKQYALVITANLSIYCAGLSIGWASPSLVKLTNTTNPAIYRPVTQEEGSWIVSIGFIVGILPMLATGFLINTLGRKFCLVLQIVPRLCASCLLTFGYEIWAVLLARALFGFSDCIAMSAVPIYASEIASKEIRGALGTLFQIICSLGILTMLCIGPFISYFSLNAMMAIVGVLTSFPLFLLPESPYYLHLKEKRIEAMDLLISLRGSEAMANETIKEYSQSGHEKRSLKTIFSDKVFYKSLGFAMILGVGANLVGFNSVSFYLQTILESSKTTLRPEVSSVIIGFIQLFASICSALVIDKFGRRAILITTIIGLAIGMLGLGTFFSVKEQHASVVGLMNYLPLVSLILVVYSYSAGFGSINWLLIAELFDNPTRGIGGAISALAAVISLFICTKYFIAVIVALGGATYWLFSGACILMLLFVVLLLPETKGKSFAEIQEELSGNKKSVNHVINK